MVLDDDGVVMELVGFRFAVLKPQPPRAALYCPEWVERALDDKLRGDTESAAQGGAVTFQLCAA